MQERDRDAVLGYLGGFMPVGFYYRAFFKPGKIWERFWEPIVRAKAGLGRIDLDAPHGFERGSRAPEPFFDRETHPVQDRNAAVAGPQVANLEHHARDFRPR